MPVYEYLCRTCDSRFEARRSMGEAGTPIDCPGGHTDTVKVLSVFASVGRSGNPEPVQSKGGPVGGGGCGAGCACAHTG